MAASMGVGAGIHRLLECSTRDRYVFCFLPLPSFLSLMFLLGIDLKGELDLNDITDIVKIADSKEFIFDLISVTRVYRFSGA